MWGFLFCEFGDFFKKKENIAIETNAIWQNFAPKKNCTLNTLNNF